MSSPPSLSPETEAAIGEFVQGVKTSRRWEESVRAELAAHLRDKILAYLSGEEAVSEADALVLARAHFGDPKKVGRLMRGVQGAWPAGYWQNLQRETLALVWAVAITFAVTVLVYVPLLVFHAAWVALATRQDIDQRPFQAVAVLAYATGPVVFWFASRRVRGLVFTRSTWALWGAAGLALIVGATVLYGGLFGWWSDPEWGPGIFLLFIPRYGIWLEMSDSLIVVLAAVVFWCMLACMFLKQVTAGAESLRGVLVGLGAWLAGIFAVRTIIWLALWGVSRIYYVHMLYNSGAWDFERITQEMLKLVAGFGIHDISAGLLMASVMGIVVWRRAGRAGRVGQVHELA